MGQLRNKIYRNLLILDGCIDISTASIMMYEHIARSTLEKPCSTYHAPRRISEGQLVPSHIVPRSKSEASAQLLTTCKQVYNEGLPILYGKNPIYFPSQSELERFGANHPRHAALIRHLAVGQGLGCGTS